LNCFFIFLPFVTTVSGLRLSFGCFVPGDAHLIVSICFVNAAFHAGSREPCRNRRDKRCHPVQQEKQAKVTLEPEKSVGGSRKNRECPLSAVRPSLSGTNLSDFGQHAAPITAGPAAPFFQNVSASLYGTLRFVFDDFGQ
jgi:hypothetical protein